MSDNVPQAAQRASPAATEAQLPNPMQVQLQGLPPPARPPDLPRWHRNPRPLNLQALRWGEIVTEVTFLTLSGYFVTYPKALMSRRWPSSFVAAGVAEVAGLQISHLPEPFAIRAPRSVRSTRAAMLWFELEGAPMACVEAMVLETETHGYLGVNLILGRPFIDRYYGAAWPPQYVPPPVGEVGFWAGTAGPGTGMPALPVVDGGPFVLEGPAQPFEVPAEGGGAGNDDDEALAFLENSQPSDWNW